MLHFYHVYRNTAKTSTGAQTKNHLKQMAYGVNLGLVFYCGRGSPSLRLKRRSFGGPKPHLANIYKEITPMPGVISLYVAGAGVAPASEGYEPSMILTNRPRRKVESI